ncbi:DUF4157 domain-containing protein [Archangium lansingense]|uniref:eCIS core domain-containing protein n=1 Tax=Archangium lansingense TaxID=2995310 RepID=UPI003B79DF9A
MASHTHSSKTITGNAHAVRHPAGVEATKAEPEGLDAEAAARHGHRFGGISVTAPARGASMGGQPLPASLQQEMQRTLRTDFSDVRLHIDSRPSLHRKDALTQGNHIHVSPEAYRPHEPAGKGLLAHELTHVVQQRGGRVAQPSGSGALNSAPGLESEADAVGMKVAQGGLVPLHGPRPSPAGGMASGPAAAAPIQGGNFLTDFFSKQLNKFKRKQVDALTKHENLPEDKQSLLESAEEHDAKRAHKLSKMKKKSANVVASGAMKVASVPGLSSAVKGAKSVRNVYNDQKTLDELAVAKKFAQGSDDDQLQLLHPLSQVEPSEDAAEMISNLETVTKGKQAAHASAALLPMTDKVRKKLQKKQIENASEELQSGVEVNDPYSLHSLQTVSKNNKKKAKSARTAKQIAKIL